MKIGKFVGQKNVDFNFDSVIDKLTEAGFVGQKSNSLVTSKYFVKTVPNVLLYGVHNSWHTNYHTKSFKMVPNRIVISFELSEGYVEGDANSPITQQYSGRSTLYGGYAYKNSRRQSEALSKKHDEIYNKYEYETDINVLIDTLIAEANRYLN